MIKTLAAQVSKLIDNRVQVAFVDVVDPTPRAVLSSLRHAEAAHRPAIIVPAFLSRGYHIRVDLPAQIAASGHPNVIVTPALGTRPEITWLVAQQLLEAGWLQGDSVILAAAGTTDRRARTDLHTAAKRLGTLIESQVQLAFTAIGTPDVPTAVVEARRQGAQRVVVASYLLADGLFQERLRRCGADVVTPPLCAHPGLAPLIANQFANITASALRLLV